MWCRRKRRVWASRSPIHPKKNPPSVTSPFPDSMEHPCSPFLRGSCKPFAHAREKGARISEKKPQEKKRIRKYLLPLHGPDFLKIPRQLRSRREDRRSCGRLVAYMYHLSLSPPPFPDHLPNNPSRFLHLKDGEFPMRVFVLRVDDYEGCIGWGRVGGGEGEEGAE